MESNEGNGDENMLDTKSTGGGGCDNSVTVKTSYQHGDLLKTKNSPRRKGQHPERILSGATALQRSDSCQRTMHERRSDHEPRRRVSQDILAER